MVALDHSAHFDTEPARPPLAVIACALLALSAFAAGFFLRGLGEDGGKGLGTQLVWRLGCLVFFAALVADPLGRVIPVLADRSRVLLQGFCAVLAVYFAVLLLPNLFAVPDGVRPAGITAGMTIFILFTGSVTMVMASALSNGLCARVGKAACRAMLGVAVIYFWLCYALIGLAHISRPHRPDIFYELSVILMVTALLARFADHFAAARQVPAA